MEWPVIVVGLLFAAGASFVIGWLLASSRTQKHVTELSTTLEIERRTASERLIGLEQTFAALSSEALRQNNQTFLDLAKQTFVPIKDSLDRFDSKAQEIEKARVGAYEGLVQQVSGLMQAQNTLRAETANLVNALRTPRVRGRWGEIQLKRVVELADMLEHCDFFQQPSVTTEDGRLRPDMIIRLPGGRNIVVDAKVPLEAYLMAMEAKDENVRTRNLDDYACHIRDHISALSNKSYWDQFQPAPEFVFMFLPAEAFYSAALEQDPSLIEQGVKQRVIIATPTTLIALLKAVAYGWRQEKLAESAEQIGALGKELYERVCKMGEHFAALGSSLRNAVDRYNDALGSLESRVLVSARRFRELPIASTDKEINAGGQIETIPRQLQAPEMQVASETDIVPKA